MGGQAQLSGPDLVEGVALSAIPDGGTLLGHAHGEGVVLVRRGAEVFAVGATCSHYGGPLAEGLVVGDQIRCPWHHACFELRTGAPHAPALNPIACFEVERRGDRVVLGARKEIPSKEIPTTVLPGSVVIVGAGAAGNAAAEMLRRLAYPGRVTMIGADPSVPVDRPNLSKDYLAGNAPEEWIPLRGPEFYAQESIDVVLGTRVTELDPKGRKVTLSDGRVLGFGALILATGADPVRLPIPGAELPHVHVLRTIGDSRAIIAKLGQAKRAVVVGASFIGLEVAASLRTRGLEVNVVAPETRPLERVLGAELGDFVRTLHEEKGVRFHLGKRPQAIDAERVRLDDGSALEADLVVLGVGVRPAVELARAAGLTVDDGVVVNEYLETSAPGVYAVGDLARFPDARSGKSIRVEHWVVAERQGQTAARNVLGLREKYRTVPFFWSQHYDVPIAYVGHAERRDRIEVIGSIAERNCLVVYREGNRAAAVASIYRDQESLRIEAAMERGDDAEIERILAAARG